MQSRSFLLLIFTLMGGLVLLTSCKPHQLGSSVGVLKTATVRLNVSGPPQNKQLRVDDSTDRNCKRSNELGCVEVPKHDEALISFRLTPNAGWRFAEIKICVGGTKSTQVCTLNAHQQKEFDASLSGGTMLLNPDEDGVIDLTQLSPDINQAFTAFDLYDQNWVAQDYFYSIRVCPTGITPTPTDPNCIWTDPPIENGGRGRNISNK